jgi:hypothetical protein
MNRFLELTLDELDTLSDALMFDRLDMKGLGEKLLDEVMDARDSKKELKS